jgi:hypothetical protein
MTGGDLYGFARRFNGKPMQSFGKYPKIKKDPRQLPKGDFPSLIPGVPVFSQRAVEAFGDLLKGNGEIFPLKISGDQYFLFNVTKVIEALDEFNSIVSRFRDGRVFYIDHYSFFVEKLLGLIIFKIPHTITGDVYVTDAFVERVDATRLKGFWFPLVWSSD